MGRNDSPASERLIVRIASTNGRVDVAAEERDDVDVRGDARVDHAGGQTTIDGLHGRLRVRVPVGSDVVIGTTSGRVDVSGPIGSASVTTESGRVTIAESQSVDVRSIAGRIEIERSEGACCLRSENGSVTVGSCAHADVATSSGRIVLHDVRGVATAHCTSGRIDITMAGAHDVVAETVTGRIAVSLPAGVRAFFSDGSQDSPADADCTVYTRSVTGHVDVVTR